MIPFQWRNAHKCVWVSIVFFFLGYKQQDTSVIIVPWKHKHRETSTIISIFRHCNKNADDRISVWRFSHRPSAIILLLENPAQIFSSFKHQNRQRHLIFLLGNPLYTYICSFIFLDAWDILSAHRKRDRWLSSKKADREWVLTLVLDSNIWTKADTSRHSLCLEAYTNRVTIVLYLKAQSQSQIAVSSWKVYTVDCHPVQVKVEVLQPKLHCMIMFFWTNNTKNNSFFPGRWLENMLIIGLYFTSEFQVSG